MFTIDDKIDIKILILKLEDYEMAYSELFKFLNDGEFYCDEDMWFLNMAMCCCICKMSGSIDLIKYYLNNAENICLNKNDSWSYEKNICNNFKKIIKDFECNNSGNIKDIDIYKIYNNRLDKQVNLV